jgi:hypothetical protein
VTWAEMCSPRGSPTICRKCWLFPHLRVVSISVCAVQALRVLDDEALEAAREDRDECDRNEAMRCSFEHSKMVFNRR